MPIEILMPALSPTMEEGTLAKWLVNEGDEVASGDLLAEIETDKATMEFEAVDDGTIGKILVEAGSTNVAVNTPIAVLLADGESMQDIVTGSTERDAKESGEDIAQKSSEPAEAPPATRDDAGARIFASPLARRIAAEKGIDLAGINGSGPRGRIVKADLEGAQPTASPAAAVTKARDAAPAAAPSAGPSSDQIAKMFEGREYEEVALDGMRRTVAARLTEAKQTIPHFYLRRSIRLDPLLDFRAKLNAQLEARGIKISVNDFIIKAAALALQEVPDCNAVWAGDRILRLKPSDVAVAVAVEGGLYTPVIRDAHMKSLSALSKEMTDLAARARDRKLAPQEYLGGSFAVSNLGMYGIENFDAVINPPHGSILAIGAGEKKPVVGTAGTLEAATVMSVTLSVDHRVIDGALGAKFLSAIRQHLENPLAMLA